MSAVSANIYNSTTLVDIGTLFVPYSGSAAAATGIFTLSGSNYVYADW
jgi:hypothetical protein